MRNRPWLCREAERLPEPSRATQKRQSPEAERPNLWNPTSAQIRDLNQLERCRNKALSVVRRPPETKGKTIAKPNKSCGVQTFQKRRRPNTSLDILLSLPPLAVAPVFVTAVVPLHRARPHT